MIRSCFFPSSVVLAFGLLLSGCTTSEQSGERATPAAPSSRVSAPAASDVPTEVRTDADRRAIYNSSGANSSVPDATPNRVRLGNQASDINRQKRIENLNTDQPNNTTPETRIQRLSYDPPVEAPVRRP
ncbi:hypothetical protein [Hymenobacter arizonensis]|uniref:Uncharacterized protein n=1 Tax=Hymenobacter arizonensis TaxID=1227077 RepID=A0A1I5ZWA0_HYMAR|nr:hypothetical protein [Hymenobacter arizonensis]SFQ60756.1 hypothetical protein SAMN04515668_3262 [Hymenobacter arizonensis]